MRDLHHQLHGYRHGHELLASTIKLPKLDQELVDRLSDVAGPLSPGEQFPPYLTCYPLPSGRYYVVARTWQDLQAPRAGCVRTRSLFIEMEDWVTYEDLGVLPALLARLGPAGSFPPLPPSHDTQIPAEVDTSEVNELCEALFLEERKPVAVFGSGQAEEISLLLLAALWPAIRGKFALSTLAFSPRKLGARSFDLVFAPKSARPRFVEWPGRRLDGSFASPPRHRWTPEIVRRIFRMPVPSLVKDDELGLLASDPQATEADLRISLLWNELFHKLETSPKAVLGLLDIANSRPAGDGRAFKLVAPELQRIVQDVARSAAPSEAWQFLVATADKVQGTPVSEATNEALRLSATTLAARAPSEAVFNLPKVAKAKSVQVLLPSLGEGLVEAEGQGWQRMLLALPQDQFLQSLLASSSLASAVLSGSATASGALQSALRDASSETTVLAKKRLLPLLVHDADEEPFRTLIYHLDTAELEAEIVHLFEANRLGALRLHEPLWTQAARLGATVTTREVVAGLEGEGPELLLEHLISEGLEDLRWVLESPKLSSPRRRRLLLAVLRRASDLKLSELESIYGQMLGVLADGFESDADVLVKLLREGWRDIAAAYNTLLLVLPHLDHQQAQEMSSLFVPWVMRLEAVRRDRRGVERLLETAGGALDGDATYRAALATDIPGDLVSENLSLLNRAKAPGARGSLLSAVERLSRGILDRGALDLSPSASADAAQLLWDAREQNFWGHFRAATELLPFLLNQRGEAASPLIAAAFPAVYIELKKENAAPDIFRLFFFVDWDRCKTLRKDLIDAFFASNWSASDIALAAARTGDELKMLRRIYRHEHGADAIAVIERDLHRIPRPWAERIRAAIANLEAQ